MDLVNSLDQRQFQTYDKRSYQNSWHLLCSKVVTTSQASNSTKEVFFHTNHYALRLES
jgi:hypothetical protein